MRYSIGIDLGKNGAVVIHDLETGKIEKFVMPVVAKQLDLHTLYELLSAFKGQDVMVAMEDLRAIFGSSATATFTFGFVCGATEALIVSLGLPYRKVNAKVWQKEAFAGVPEVRKPGKVDKNGKKRKGAIDTKAMALLASKRLFPDFDTTPTERSVKPHDGIVDALLISWWVTQNYK